ncbi:hypothetical protein HYPSUDRAFT_216398, partial [Hypholoma sublateritium FD-334 SS-4]
MQMIDNDETADSLEQVSTALVMIHLAALLTELFGVVVVTTVFLPRRRRFHSPGSDAYAFSSCRDSPRADALTLFLRTQRTRSWPSGAPPTYFAPRANARPFPFLHVPSHPNPRVPPLLLPSAFAPHNPRQSSPADCVAAWVHAALPAVAAVFVFGVLPRSSSSPPTRQAASPTHPGAYAPVVRAESPVVSHRGGWQVHSTFDCNLSSTTTATTTTTAPANTRGGVLIPGMKRASPSPLAARRRNTNKRQYGVVPSLIQ